MCKEAAKTLYRQKQLALFIEAHNKGFTNADIAALLGLSVGYVNNCACCSDALLSGPQMDEFIRKCALVSALEYDAHRAEYVLYKVPQLVGDPIDILLAAAELKREESEDERAVAEVLIKIKGRKSIQEHEKAAFRRECEETISRRLELIAAVEKL